MLDLKMKRKRKMSKKNGRSFKEIIKEFKNDQIITYDLLPTINIYFPKTNNVNKLQIYKRKVFIRQVDLLL